MKIRCYNPKRKEYKTYGGKGIIICDEWLESFDNFAIWALNNGYELGLTIDRIDSDGNYEPSNCRWLSRSENSRRVHTGVRQKVRDLSIREEEYKN